MRCSVCSRETKSSRFETIGHQIVCCLSCVGLLVSNDKDKCDECQRPVWKDNYYIIDSSNYCSEKCKLKAVKRYLKRNNNLTSVSIKHIQNEYFKNDSPIKDLQELRKEVKELYKDFEFEDNLESKNNRVSSIKSSLDKNKTLNTIKEISDSKNTYDINNNNNEFKPEYINEINNNNDMNDEIKHNDINNEINNKDKNLNDVLNNNNNDVNNEINNKDMNMNDELNNDMNEEINNEMNNELNDDEINNEKNIKKFHKIPKNIPRIKIPSIKSKNNNKNLNNFDPYQCPYPYPSSSNSRKERVKSYRNLRNNYSFDNQEKCLYNDNNNNDIEPQIKYVVLKNNHSISNVNNINKNHKKHMKLKPTLLKFQNQSKDKKLK